MRIANQAGAGRDMGHHQGHVAGPAHRSGVSAVQPAGASTRASECQCELPLSTPSLSRGTTRERSRADRVASFMAAFFDHDPSVYRLLEATASAAERRRGQSRFRPARNVKRGNG